MSHAIRTDDFLAAIDEFDLHARQGRSPVRGNSCSKPEDAERPWNPLHGDAHAAAWSSGLGPHEGLLHHVAKGFPCVAARSAFNPQGYRLGLYADMGSPDAALAVCHDLYEFAHEFEQADASRFATFIAVFKGPHVCSEQHFENLLWRQLQIMHGVDAQHFDWDDSVSADPGSKEFSFSIGGRAYFVVGLNPCASQLSRVKPWPCIVFNPHQQFEQLRHDGKYDGLKKAIRARAVPNHWTCPFLQQARTLS